MLKTKSGAASFYIVTIATLILVILATSFATAILAAITRSANDDLAQSAYDSAMAGVEEAKLAYANYRNCVNLHPDWVGHINSLSEGNEVTCQDIIYWVEHEDTDTYNSCDMVALILGRIGKTGNSSSKDKRAEIGEISLDQTAAGGNANPGTPSSSNLDQAYTCVKINVNPDTLFENLSSVNPYRVIKLNTDNAAAVESIVLSWHMNQGDTNFAYTNIVEGGNDINDSKVVFPPISTTDLTTNTITENIPTPATISFTIIQTPNTGFTFNELNGTSAGSSTNRTTMFFVPTKQKEIASAANHSKVTSSSTYIGTYYDNDDNANIGNNINYLSASQVASTNNHEKNLPYVVYCNEDKKDDFACAVEMDLPKPNNGEERSNYTFAFIVSLPYGKPSTVFSVEFTCNNGKACNFTNAYKTDNANPIFDNDQVVIDSTGRAGDMYKRVEVSLKSEITARINGYPFYAIQADTITKNNQVDNEWGVEVPETPEPEPPVIADSCDDAPYMQDWDGANLLATHQVTYLRDNRDNECYPVIKLKDSHVWLQKNLRLNFANPSVTITKENTNNPTNGFISAVSSHPSSIPKWDKCFSGICYVIEGESIGAQYTWMTAMAYNSSAPNTDTNGDICPKGWHVPSKSDAVKMLHEENPSDFPDEWSPNLYLLTKLNKIPLNLYETVPAFYACPSYAPNCQEIMWLSTNKDGGMAYGLDKTGQSARDGIGNPVRCMTN